ncbi:MAG: Glu/Leu/Phe/Val dehydrogenase dimerization domain-containing protein [Antarcticimicrobium sp.]|uniref:Leu/Phe/Val dehydrogenase n=1 Tax=Antarcticimicrobium sp. TaxID=2824147 RepID=UPI0026236C67|nr:Glu/Leu/Phe/Val dehydrogenase dimerization domain-containing protein [Antarcticimicrobium sp.]MDF1717666.1 Glu/Leu/Phe/Val dehydrogenase dimerization domain-containing protein [Antarcticimicrobium sp.]
MELTQIETQDHEQVLRVRDADSGLSGIIAIHSTQLGPAAGGLRMRSYADEAAALEDALRLSRGMTFKNAAAGLPLGGGKAVIIGDPARDKTPEMLATFGRAVEALGGRYWTAEDMGMTPADMARVGTETRFVAGLADGPFASGDPSPVTARGIFNAIRTTARHRFGSSDLAGLRVAVQGLGHVGLHLCDLLHRAGAELIVSDLNDSAVTEAQARFAARVVAPEAILTVEAEILAPCAIGAVLNEVSIPDLRVQAVAGGANNQLATAGDGARLHARGILYAPDFIANGGGIINVATEILRIADHPSWVAEKLGELDATMDRTLTRAAQRGVSPNDVAEEIVAERLRHDAA